MNLRRLALPTLLAVGTLLGACSSPVKLEEPKPAVPAPITQPGTPANRNRGPARRRQPLPRPDRVTQTAPRHTLPPPKGKPP